MNDIESDATTELLPRALAADPGPAAAPVFVDTSGRRRRAARRIVIGALTLSAGYVLMVVWSLLGGPVSPDNLVPFSAPRPAPTAKPSVAAPIRVPSVVASTLGTHAANVIAASPNPTPVTTTSSAASASASVSASTNGHRPTSAPGKPTASSTTGHGH